MFKHIHKSLAGIYIYTYIYIFKHIHKSPAGIYIYI